LRKKLRWKIKEKNWRAENFLKTKLGNREPSREKNFAKKFGEIGKL